MGRTDDCHKKADTDTDEQGENCDDHGIFQTIQQPGVSVIFYKIDIKIVSKFFKHIISLFICLSNGAVPASLSAPFHIGKAARTVCWLFSFFQSVTLVGVTLICLYPKLIHSKLFPNSIHLGDSHFSDSLCCIISISQLLQ